MRTRGIEVATQHVHDVLKKDTSWLRDVGNCPWNKSDISRQFEIILKSYGSDVSGLSHTLSFWLQTVGSKLEPVMELIEAINEVVSVDWSTVRVPVKQTFGNVLHLLASLRKYDYSCDPSAVVQELLRTCPPNARCDDGQSYTDIMMTNADMRCFDECIEMFYRFESDMHHTLAIVKHLLAAGHTPSPAFLEIMKRMHTYVTMWTEDHKKHVINHFTGTCSSLLKDLDQCAELIGLERPNVFFPGRSECIARVQSLTHKVYVKDASDDPDLDPIVQDRAINSYLDDCFPGQFATHNRWGVAGCMINYTKIQHVNDFESNEEDPEKIMVSFFEKNGFVDARRSLTPLFVVYTKDHAHVYVL